VAIVNTRLELDIQADKADELDFILQTLDGMKDLSFDYIVEPGGYPEYTWKNPEQVATDYLTKVYQSLEKEMSKFGDTARDVLVVDIVITVPVAGSQFLSLSHCQLTAVPVFIVQGQKFYI
jgi:hypothetical protein